MDPSLVCFILIMSICTTVAFIAVAIASGTFDKNMYFTLAIFLCIDVFFIHEVAINSQIEDFCASKSLEYSSHKTDLYIQCSTFREAFTAPKISTYPYSEYELWLEGISN